VKQNKKAKICFVIYIAGFLFLKFFCYEVIVKQKNYKRSSNYYLSMATKTKTLARITYRLHIDSKKNLPRLESARHTDLRRPGAPDLD
jgi:hypothetical protein